MKPKWEDVPEGYDWMAQQPSGIWIAYTCEPSLSGRVWCNDIFHATAERLNDCSPLNPDWESTLEKRPEKCEYTINLILSNPEYGVPFTLQFYADLYTKMIRELMPNIFTGGNKMNFTGCNNYCPTTRELTPLERIEAKKAGLQKEIDTLNKRVSALNDIKTSVSWKVATDEMKSKAVEAADRV